MFHVKHTCVILMMLSKTSEENIWSKGEIRGKNYSDSEPERRRREDDDSDQSVCVSVRDWTESIDH